MYALTLQPIPRNPHLTESVLRGLKLPLSIMFGDPFSTRNVLIAVRELLENVVAYADWTQSPEPTFAIRGSEGRCASTFSIWTMNVAKDVEQSKRSAAQINGYIEDAPRTPLKQRLSEQLIESASSDAGGGIGLLQVACLPGCHLEVCVQGSVFCVCAELEVIELRPRSELPAV